VEPIAVEARRQGAILDLDKHSWPWSLMLVPIMNVDLFEVSNNHMWRTEFLFHDWTIETLPAGWDIETTERGWTEWGWIDFGFKTWYALLNCGFPLRPTAGTASGVHPVPLGFGRVYVFLPEGFQFQSWMDGLNAGRSFVSTGPMLLATVNEQLPGSHIHADSGTTVRVRGTAESPVPIDLIEIVVNGQVRSTPPAANHPTPAGGYVSEFDVETAIDESSWLAVRCFERHPTRKHRFAHTAPVHVTVPDRPLRARSVEVDYFVRRMEEEIERNQGVLEEREVAEYRRALEIFREIARRAR
jgi:hypothetical protein